MNIIFVENIDPYIEPSGGIGIYLKQLTLFLKSRNIHTTLVGAGSPAEGQDPADLKIPVDRFIPVLPRKRGHPVYIKALFSKVRSLPLEPGAIIHGQRPDVLFPFVFRANKYPMLCSLHAIHSKAVSRKKGMIQSTVYRFLERYVLKRVQRIAAVGQGVTDYFKETYPFCAHRLVNIPVGVDMDRFQPLAETQKRGQAGKTQKRGQAGKECGFEDHDEIILVVGRLEKEKNITLILDAFKEVKPQIPNAQLVILGKGREEESLKAHAAALNVAGIQFRGSVPSEQVPLFMKGARVLALASLFEGGPLVVKEALACNVPVVATDVGEVRAILQHLEGSYVAKFDHHDFAGHLIAVLTSDKTYNSRDYMQAHHSIAATFEKTLALYQEMSR